MTYLDTHVVCWLYAGLTERIPSRVQETLEQGDLRISPMVALEVQHLHEIGRLAAGAEDVVGALQRDLGLRVCELPFPAVVTRALAHTWTRDPFDRLIVAQADLESRALLTKDSTIRKHYPLALWE